MNNVALLLFAIGLATSEIASAHDADKCAPRAIHRETYPDVSFKDGAPASGPYVTLSPEWDDGQILKAFGLTHAIADESVQGVDGAQANFHVGKNSIAIVRSASSGLVIRISHGRYAGYWIVAPCY